MKRISIAGLIGLSVFAAASWAQSFSWRIETPFGELSGSVDPIQLLANPGSYLDPTGVPNTATLLQEAIKNPDRVISLLQNPGDAPYELIASGMVAGRNAVLVKGGNRIPPDVREKLKGWYDDALLDSIRWSTEWNALQSTLQTVQFFGDRKTNAITLLNVVVFREPRMVDNVGLWAHELYHAEQYRDLGVLEFAKRWAKDPSDGGEIEKPAYDRQHQVEQAQTAGTAPLNA